MIAVIQRVKEAKVVVEQKVISSIGYGLLVFLAIEKNDGEKELKWMAEKVSKLRIFGDENDKMNLSVQDIGGELLVVSQFTLAGELLKGSRPSFSRAENPERAKVLYDEFISILKGLGLKVKSGIFQAMMDVHLINDGPVTIILNKKYE